MACASGSRYVCFRIEFIPEISGEPTIHPPYAHPFRKRTHTQTPHCSNECEFIIPGAINHIFRVARARLCFARGGAGVRAMHIYICRADMRVCVCAYNTCMLLYINGRYNMRDDVHLTISMLTRARERRTNAQFNLIHECANIE